MFKKAFELLKAAFIYTTASSASLALVYFLFKIASSNTVIMDQIAVPPSFDESGYSSDVVGRRILDEMNVYARRTASATSRSQIFGSKVDLQAIDTQIAGFSAQELIIATSELLGKKVTRISGEITQRKDGDNTIYRVRLRMLPQKRILFDFEQIGTAQQIIRKTAMRLFEKTDPMVAAAVYESVFKDRNSALRLIDVVLSDPSSTTKKNALNLKAQIAIGEKDYDEAEGLLKQSLAIDSKFPATYNNIVNLHLSKGDHDNAAKFADEALKNGPDQPYGYFAKGRIALAKKEFISAYEYFDRSTRIMPDYSLGYNWAGLTAMAEKRYLLAIEWFNRGKAVRPEFTTFYANHAKALVALDRKPEAIEQMEIAYSLEPENPEYIIQYLELLSFQNYANKRKRVISEAKILLESEHLNWRHGIEKRLKEEMNKENKGKH